MNKPESYYQPLLAERSLPHYDLRQRAVAVVAACAVAATLVLSGVGKKVDGWVDGLTACPHPDDESIRAVSALFDTPQPSPVYTSSNKWGRSEEYRAFLKQKDEELGITFPTIDVDWIEELRYGVHQPDKAGKPFSAYWTTLQSLSSQLAIPLEIGAPWWASDIAKNPTPEELETNKAKRQVFNLITMFALTPKNLTANLGIKKIHLTAHGEGFAGLANSSNFAILGDGEILIDVVNDHFDDSTAEHELHHMYDSLYCGTLGLDIDPGYEALNDKSAYAEQWPLPADFMGSQPATLQDVIDEYYRINNGVLHDARERGDIAAYCSAANALEHLLAEVEMTRPYSHKEVGEDKADVGKEIFSPGNYDRMLDHRSPVLRNKFLYLLARVYETHPDVLMYYYYHSYRYSIDSSRCTDVTSPAQNKP